MTKTLTPTRLLLAAAALTMATTTANAQDFSPEAVQTGQDLTTASQGLYDIFTGVGGDPVLAVTNFLDGTAQETREFFEDTTEQFAFDPNMPPATAAAAGGLNMQAALPCASLPDADTYKGSGLELNTILAEFAGQVSECLSALDHVTSQEGIAETLTPLEEAFGFSVSDEFKQSIKPIDQARMEAILYAVSYPVCIINQTPAACAIVRKSQP